MKFLDLNLTEKDLGLVVHIYDTRAKTDEGVKYNNICVLDYIEGNQVYTNDITGPESYYVNKNGSWGVGSKPQLGITKIYSKEEYPEYYI